MAKATAAVPVFSPEFKANPATSQILSSFFSSYFFLTFCSLSFLHKERLCPHQRYLFLSGASCLVSVLNLLVAANFSTSPPCCRLLFPATVSGCGVSSGITLYRFCPILPFHKFQVVVQVQGFYADDATSRLEDRILKINHQFSSFSSNWRWTFSDSPRATWANTICHVSEGRQRVSAGPPRGMSRWSQEPNEVTLW